MNIKEFRSHEQIKVSNKSYGGLEWPEWYRLAKMTAKIYYGCDFNKGKCAKLREDLEINPNASEMCCCSQCADNFGYLSYIQNNAKVLKEISGLFEPKVGFWRKGSGCSLPRKYRSPTCLGFRCKVCRGKFIIFGMKGMLVKFMEGVKTDLSKKEIYILGRALLTTPIC